MKLGTRARRRPAGDRVGDLVVDVLVDDVTGTYNRYDYDARRDRIRLAATVVGAQGELVQRGHIVDTIGPDGQALGALLIALAPTFPGCLVQARIIGAVHGTDGKPWTIGVPQADPSKRHVVSLRGLQPQEVAAIERTIGGFQAESEEPTAQEVRALIHEAKQAFWRERARSQGAVRYAAAWKASPPPADAGGRGEAEPHTWAEYLIPSLPLRFQRHVEEMLLPDERILFFVERPEFTPAGRLALFRNHKLRHGLLIVTDRQVLTMFDSLPPDLTMVDWGYAAKATAIERVESAWMERRDSAAEFGLAICAEGGTERYALLFPASHEEPLRETVRVLDAFARPPANAVARLYEGAPDLGGHVDQGDLPTTPPHLAELVQLAGKGQVLAAAAARAPEGQGLGPAVVVTSTRVLVFAGARSRKGGLQPLDIPIPSLSSVELTQSLIACRFDLFIPHDEDVERITLKYDYPDSAPFRRVFVTVRHLLGRLVVADSNPG